MGEKKGMTAPENNRKEETLYDCATHLILMSVLKCGMEICV